MRATKVAALLLCVQLSEASTPAAVVASPLFPGHQSHVRKPIFAQTCSLPPGWNTVLARKPRFVVFGEVHGTQEAPAFVGNLACALAARGKRVLVAVEHSAIDNDAVQKAWRLSDAQFPAALKLAGWAGREDGVASKAMLALLVRLHQLATRDRLIDIVAFNGAKDETQEQKFSQLPGQGPHEAAQAENIHYAAVAQPYDQVLVLVGNTHARKRPVDYAGATFEPMVMRLALSGPIVTLKMETAGGTAWNCELKHGVTPGPNKPVTASDVACGAFPLNGRAKLLRAPFMALTALPGTDFDPDYDGIFWLGRVSASLPAVPSR